MLNTFTKYSVVLFGFAYALGIYVVTGYTYISWQYYALLVPTMIFMLAIKFFRYKKTSANKAVDTSSEFFDDFDNADIVYEQLSSLAFNEDDELVLKLKVKDSKVATVYLVKWLNNADSESNLLGCNLHDISKITTHAE